jgi:two-component system OmpR family sensor kinase
MKSFSLTRRLLAWLTFSIVIFWGLAAGLGAYVMHTEFGEIFDSSMQRTAERLIPLVLDDLEKDAIPQSPMPVQAKHASTDDYLTYQVRDAGGKVLMHSFKTPPEPYNAPLTPGFWEDSTARVFTAAAENNTVFVQVADSLAHRTEATQDGAVALLLPIVVLVPLNIMALLLIVRGATKPLTSLRQTIAAKDSGNLSPVPGDGLPRELQPIANSLNLLLSRLDSALSAEREFTANSAHELRTPIAGAIAQAQMHIQELGSISPHLQRAELIEHSLQRLNRITEKLLQLSRADAGIGVSETPQNLISVVEMIIEDFQRRIGDDQKLEVVLKPDADLVERVSLDAFAIVVRNLVENAIAHGDGNGGVKITIGPHTLIVSNPSKPYADAELDHLRKRFVRDDSVSEGTGLGLSIVERLLDQMRASLELRSLKSGDQQLFEAVVRFH